jgi:hypothetical protein
LNIPQVIPSFTTFGHAVGWASMNNHESGLYDALSLEELREARENLERYFDLALDVASQQSALSDVTVDISLSGHTMKQRSKINSKH